MLMYSMISKNITHACCITINNSKGTTVKQKGKDRQEEEGEKRWQAISETEKQRSMIAIRAYGCLGYYIIQDASSSSIAMDHSQGQAAASGTLRGHQCDQPVLRAPRKGEVFML